MSALRMPTVKQDPVNQPTEAVGRSCYTGVEDMQMSSPKLINLILANLPVDSLRVSRLPAENLPYWFLRQEE